MTTKAQLETILPDPDRLRESAREREGLPLPAECGELPADWEERVERARVVVRRAIESQTKGQPVKLYKWVHPLRVIKLDDGWWLDAEGITPDVPQWGPYRTIAEAKEARRSYLRCHPELKKIKVPA